MENSLEWLCAEGKKLAFGTIDNPGWTLSFLLEDTAWENKSFQGVDIQRTDEDDWIHTSIRCDKYNFDGGKSFSAAGGPLNLIEMIDVLQDWIGIQFVSPQHKSIDTLTWLQNWYFAMCDGDWEHSFGISIKTLSEKGWFVSISISGTDVEEKAFDSFQIIRSKEDWMQAYTGTDPDDKRAEDEREKNFYGKCGPKNLIELIEAFRTWVGEDIAVRPKNSARYLAHKDPAFRTPEQRLLLYGDANFKRQTDRK